MAVKLRHSGSPLSELHHAGFEIDAEPLPLQKEQAARDGRIVRSPSRQKSARRKEQHQKSRFQQHAVGLIARKSAAATKERKQTKQTKKLKRGHKLKKAITAATRPIQRHRHHRRGCSTRSNRARGRTSSGQAELLRHGGQIISRGKNALGTDQALDLNQERIERGEVNRAPARAGKSSAEPFAPAGRGNRRRATGRRQPACSTACLEQDTGWPAFLHKGKCAWLASNAIDRLAPLEYQAWLWLRAAFAALFTLAAVPALDLPARRPPGSYQLVGRFLCRRASGHRSGLGGHAAVNDECDPRLRRFSCNYEPFRTEFKVAFS